MPKTWREGKLNKTWSSLFSQMACSKCKSLSFILFVLAWAEYLFFNYSETWGVYLFIRFSLIRTFVLTNKEVVALASSLHPPSPGCLLRNCLSEEKRHPGSLVDTKRQADMHVRTHTHSQTARLSELGDTDTFKNIGCVQMNLNKTP